MNREKLIEGLANSFLLGSMLTSIIALTVIIPDKVKYGWIIFLFVCLVIIQTNYLIKWVKHNETE